MKKYRLLNFAGLAFLTSMQVNAQTSVLKYGLSEWVNRPTPAIQLLLNPLMPLDVTNTAQYPQEHSSLQMSASGGVPAIMAQFRAAIASDLYSDRPPNYPGCPVVTNPLINIHTFQKPYMVRQGDYQGWVNAYGSRQNLAAPKGLALNAYQGNLICPLFVSDEASLKKTLGYSVKGLGSGTTSDSIEMLIDNSKNPWRWAGPVNVVHHVEQPAMAMLIHASPEAALTAGKVLTAYANSGAAPAQRIYLDYSIDISVEDLRVGLGEYSVDDYLSGSPGKDLLFWTKAITFNPVNPIPFPNEMRQYYQKRVYEPSVQLSLMVNLREDGKAWVEQEFMLASLNYQRDSSYPQSPNATMNQFIYEGGNNAAGASWYRLKVNALTDVPGIIPQGPRQIVKSGNGFWNIPAHQNSANTMWGSIDLTEFVRVAKGHQFLPGHKPVAGTIPTEQAWDRLSLNWAGVVFESHGPFKTKVKVRTFGINYR